MNQKVYKKNSNHSQYKILNINYINYFYIFYILFMYTQNDIAKLRRVR